MKSIFPDIDKSKLDDFYIKIGQNVKKIRKEKGLSQLVLSSMKKQKSTSFYSNCENYKNKEHFNLEHLFLISDVLSVEIEEFFK